MEGKFSWISGYDVGGRITRKCSSFGIQAARIKTSPLWGASTFAIPAETMTSTREIGNANPWTHVMD